MSESVTAPRRWRIAVVGLACFGAAVSASVVGLTRLADALIDDGAPVSGELATSQPASAVLYDEWQERISRESTWRNSRSNLGGATGNSAPGRQQPRRLQGPAPATTPAPATVAQSWFFGSPQPASAWNTEPSRGRAGGQPYSAPSSRMGKQSSGYRTVCVRLCDGFFFPVSHGASEGSFGRDQATCSSTCPGSRLFYYRASDDPEDMVDVSGQAYAKLKNANLFRTQYVESCKCKPHPWEQASTDRHRIYALEDRRRKGDRSVVAELDALKAKNRITTRLAERQRANARGRRGAAVDAEVASAPPATVPGQITAPRSDVSRNQGNGLMTGSIVAAASAATVQSVTAETNAAMPLETAAGTPGVVQARSAATGGRLGPDPAEMQPTSPITGTPLRMGNGSAGVPSGQSDLPLRAADPAPAPAPRPGVDQTEIDDLPITTPRMDRRSSRSDRKKRAIAQANAKSRQVRAAAARSQPNRSRTAEWTNRVFSPF